MADDFHLVFDTDPTASTTDPVNLLWRGWADTPDHAATQAGQDGEVTVLTAKGDVQTFRLEVTRSAVPVE